MRRTAAWAGVVAMAGSALCACADLSRATALIPAPINPESPIAPAAVAASKQSYAYPRFRDIPPRPTDLPTPVALKATVTRVARDRRGVLNWQAKNPPMVGDTAGFAADARAELSPDMVKPVDPAHAQAMEAYAARERAQGAPPPPLRTPSASSPP